MWDSLDKFAKQVSVVSEHEVRYKNKILKPPTSLALTDGFWREYVCKPGCGGCCLAFSLDWLPEEWMEACETYPLLGPMGIERFIELGEGGEVISIVQERSDIWCKFFDGHHCIIHKHNPLSCRVELIKFKRSRSRGYISKTPHGRFWAMHSYSGNEVLCEFRDFSNVQLKENDIPIMEQMLRWCGYFGIQTYLPSVIDSLQNAYESGVYGRVVINDLKGQGTLF